MKRLIKSFSWFPRIPGRLWVAAYSLVALIRFALGLPVDSTTFGVVLGAWVVTKLGSKAGGGSEPT